MPKVNRPVTWSDDLRRVASLPSRTWDSRAAADLAEQCTPSLLTEAGAVEWRRLALLGGAARESAISDFSRDVCPIRLSPEQTMCAWDFVQCRGLITLAPVGVGKTLLGFVLAYLAELHFGVKTTALVVPAYLRDDTLANHLKYSKYWRAPRNGIQVISYSELGLEHNAYRLCACDACRVGVPAVNAYDGEAPPPDADPDSYVIVGARPINPELVILDEADMARSAKSAVGSRLGRWQHNHMHETLTVCMTGSFGDDFSDMFRLATWSLGPSAPVPFEYTERRAWSCALNYDVSQHGITPPGALLDAFGRRAVDGDEHSQARVAYGDRLDKTPGFVIIDRPSCTTGIYVRALTAPRDATIEAEYVPFRQYGIAKDGWILDTLSAADYATSLGQGYYNTWQPRPPVAWLEARNAYHARVNEIIKDSRRRGQPIDTEKQARRFMRGEIVVADWEAVRDTFAPNPVPQAVSPSVVYWVKQWLELNDPSIVWVDGTWFGQQLAQLTGVRYLASKGRDATGREAEPGQSMIASMQSNYRGRNWWQWNRNLVLASPGRNTWHEQIIGRTHRQGQREAVYVDYLITSGETFTALHKAFHRADGARETYKLRPKIRSAEWDWSHIPAEVANAAESNDEGFRARWQQRALDY